MDQPTRDQLSSLAEALNCSEGAAVRWALSGLAGLLRDGLAAQTLTDTDGKRVLHLPASPGRALMLAETDDGGFAPWQPYPCFVSVPLPVLKSRRPLVAPPPRRAATGLANPLHTDMTPDNPYGRDVPIRPSSCSETILVRVKPECTLVGAFNGLDPDVKFHLHSGDEAELPVDQVADLLEINAVEVVKNG